MESKIRCWAHRNYQNARGTWLLTLLVGANHGSGGGGNLFAAYPQSWAVVDDFGDLICVEAWK